MADVTLDQLCEAEMRRALQFGEAIDAITGLTPTAEIIPFPSRAKPREIDDLPRVTSTPRALDYRAWGFASQAEMERAFGDDDGPEAA